jgi:translation initiation factor 3 subunit J
VSINKMADNWDDDDEWDAADDDALDAKLGLKKEEPTANANWDDEEDLAVTEKETEGKARQAELKKKGSALQAKKAAEKERQEELELARKAMELEAEMEAKMTPQERQALDRQRIEEADHALTDDLFGAVEKMTVGQPQTAGDKVVMKDLKDHMKHARKVAECMKVSQGVVVVRSFVRSFVRISYRLIS